MTLDCVVLAVLIFVVMIPFFGIIAIHDLPYEMAKHRNQPHQDAIHVAGWISLFTLHARGAWMSANRSRGKARLSDEKRSRGYHQWMGVVPRRRGKA
jgi:hypothetical protein